MWATDRSGRGSYAGASMVAAVVAFCCAATAPRAQPVPPTVTEADIAKASKVRPVITDQDIEAAKRRYQMPSDRDLARVPVPSMPNIDALPVPQGSRRIDLGQIARGFDDATLAKAGSNALALDRSLLIFVSFSMPTATLDRLVDQAAKVGATLILRGLVDGSLQRTVLRAQSLIGSRQVGFQIDPHAFDRFAIDATPAFVLLKAGAADGSCAGNACVPSSQFALASGDVSIEYALEFFRRSSPKFRSEADGYLAKLKGAKP